MSQAEISASTPLPVFVTNSANGSALPPAFVVGSFWIRPGLSGRIKVLEISGEWVRVATLQPESINSGGENVFSETPITWLRPASFDGAWQLTTESGR